jgi:hypothetical protein
MILTLEGCYGAFFKVLKESDINYMIHEENSTATVDLGSNTNLYCSFSFNESKIWFSFSLTGSKTKSFRVLSSGNLAADMVRKLANQFKEVDKAINEFEG